MFKLTIFRPLFFLLLAVSARAGTIATATAAPSTLPAGVATTVTFKATMGSGTVVASMVNLLQVNALGQSTVVGTMYDDGTHGDTAAADGTYTLQFPIFQQTSGTLTFRVSAGFQGSLTRALSAPIPVTVTGVGTAISIASPVQSAYLSVSPTLVTGSISDPHATVTVNGLPAQVSGGSFSASIPLREGSNLITAVAQNSNGVAGTATETITLDTTPPHVTISAPIAGATTAESSVDVSGIVNDIVVGTVNPLQATVSVNGTAAQVSNRTYLATNVPLQLGPNTITSTARDRAGNFTSTSVTVTRVSTAGTATLRIVSGDGSTGAIRTQLSTPLVVQAFNASGAPIANTPVVFQVKTGDGSVTGGSTPGMSAIAVNTNAQGMAQVNYILGSRAGSGNNQVMASATGITATPVFTESATSTGAALIVVDSGGNQSGVVGQALPLPFIAIVTDAGHNRLPNIPVSFTVTQGGGTLNGKAAINTTSDSDGRVEAVLTLGPQNGISNNVVAATFPGNAGLPASFTATSYIPGPPQNTTISGVVLDNSSRPIPGVTMRVYQVNNGGSGVPQEVIPPVQTNGAGYFNITSAPVGVYKLMADGTTATAGGPFPTLEYDIVTVSGQNNTVGLPIYLQQLKPQNELCFSPTVGGTLTIPEAPGFALTVAPGSAMFPGGSRTGCISVTPVNMDKVPMVPGFGQQPRFIVTIQPVGTMFSIPAQITIPNVDGLKPRAVTEMYSYDHDLASFVAIGSGTVSEDGSVIASDPGVGVLKAGWHCGGDPNSSGSAGSLGVTINPTKIVKGVGTQFNVVASGTPPLDGTYTWELVATQPGDDTGVATLVQSPACDSLPTCTALVKGVKGGKVTLRVHFKCNTNGSEVTADARVIIVEVTKITATIVENVGTPTNITKDSTTAVPSGALTWPGSLWSGTNPLLLLRYSVPSVTLKVVTVPVATDPDVDVTFQALRDPGDAGGLGSGVPTVAKTGKDAATLSIDNKGSFQVLAFYDSNSNGTRDDDEAGIALPSLFLEATQVTNASSGQSGNVSYIADSPWTSSRVSLGTFDINNPGTAGMYLAGDVDIVGGGSDGRRGTDRVFGGWVQSLGQPGVVGGYQNAHTERYVLASNIPASGTFLPAGAAPALYPNPLLDTGKPSPGTGGDSSTLSRSRVGALTNLALGQRKRIEAVDSPSLAVDAAHPGFAASALTRYTFNLSFRGYLTLWTNVSATVTATGDVADRLYATILEQPWVVNAVYTVNPTTGAGTVATAPSYQLSGVVTHVPIVPISAGAPPIGPPTALNNVGIDAQH